MNFGVVIVASLLAMTASVSAQGQGYELDPQKVEERYNLIMGIVGRGIPYGAHAAHKPRIGSAYGHPSVGAGRGYNPTVNYGGYNAASGYKAPAAVYNAPAAGYKAPAAVYKAPASVYNAPAAGYNYNVPSGYNAPASGYNAPASGYNAVGGYNNAAAGGYRPYNQPQTRGYNVGGYPNAYSNGNLAYRPAYAATAGYKFGGGRVHPIFDNNRLYRPKAVTPGDLGSFGNKDPVYIGGQPTENVLFAQSGIPQKGVNASPKFDAYGNGAANADKKVFSGSDTIGSTYTGQPGTLYQNLPGYTNPFFNKA